MTPIPSPAVGHAPCTFTPVVQSCPRCGGSIDFDGYCEMCGAKAPSIRDHFEENPADWVAGVSDRGIRHPRNEDALALDGTAQIGGRAVLVVCDGVSMSSDSDVASRWLRPRPRSATWAPVSTGTGTWPIWCPVRAPAAC